MNESEKRLRALILERAYSDSAKTQYEADLDALKAAARDAALEEAAQYHDRKGDEARKWLDEQEQRAKPSAVASWKMSLQTHRSSAVDIRALQSQPAQVVSVEESRLVLEMHVHRETARKAVLCGLGVDLDATGGRAEPALDATCGACGRLRSEHGPDGRRVLKHESSHPRALYSVLCAGFTTSGE